MSNKSTINFNRPGANALQNFSGPLILFLVAIIATILFLLVTVRVQRVEGTEVGVKINNLTGVVNVVTESGTTIYNGVFNSFHILDTTTQRLEMSADVSRGDRRNKDDLRIKTIDGSDVFLDLTINYRLRLDMIEEAVASSGLGDAYKIKWLRDYSRSVCRSVFGEMTTEEFYDSSVRDDKARKAMDELNASLRFSGLQVERVVAEKFRFHPEYEERIREKKLADQEVEEQISKAKAAEQNQIFRVVEATKKKEVILASFDGEMRKLIVGADAEAERLVRGAEAYVIETELGADARFYEREKNAQAILAQAKAEGEALTELANAYTGEGGRTLVKRAYAKKLQELSVSGQPFTLESSTERFSHTQEAASRRRSNTE
jgi:regulator of protease activity HflC (stomatin/prohibitin superfamily)|tara:strand:- start:111984 stop:113111 length:1128 start_codon:yes stop_codon:yes gene_type:complete